jgi:hypothetical protein
VRTDQLGPSSNSGPWRTAYAKIAIDAEVDLSIRQRLSPCGSSLCQACWERSESQCLLGRELLITLAPQNDKCVVVTVRGPRTGRYFAILDELPVTRIFDAKTQVIANRRRHI